MVLDYHKWLFWICVVLLYHDFNTALYYHELCATAPAEYNTMPVFKWCWDLFDKGHSPSTTDKPPAGACWKPMVPCDQYGRECMHSIYIPIWLFKQQNFLRRTTPSICKNTSQNPAWSEAQASDGLVGIRDTKQRWLYFIAEREHKLRKSKQVILKFQPIFQKICHVRMGQGANQMFTLRGPFYSQRSAEPGHG